MGDDEIGLLNIHAGKREGRSFLLCGICKTKQDVTDAHGGPGMALAAHTVDHRADPPPAAPAATPRQEPRRG